jgi:predicted Rossmann fold flavoprotein
MKIGIVGAGAAGLIAAASIKEKNPSAEILLFERNSRVGRKVAISGGGRCNVTTGITDPKILKSKYPRGADFLKYSFKVFPPEKVIDWFESRGVKLKCEKDMRIFPASNNAEEVVELFEKLIPETFKLKESVQNITKYKDGFEITTSLNQYQVDKLILTTGGNAYSHTGSQGDGYNFAKQLGHTITDLGPSLNSFEVADDWAKNLSGLSLKSITLQFKEVSVVGDFLFTHFGVSGPAVFAFAANIPFIKIDKTNSLKISLNFGFSVGELNQLIDLNGKKTILNVLSIKLPERLSRTILEGLGINSNTKAAEISKENRRKLCSINLNLVNRRPGDEFVTAGGVELSEVNPKTMESRLTPSLFFAGELLNVDGYTGGFNLQASWATGRLAGTCCC